MNPKKTKTTRAPQGAEEKDRTPWTDVEHALEREMNKASQGSLKNVLELPASQLATIMSMLTVFDQDTWPKVSKETQLQATKLYLQVPTIPTLLLDCRAQGRFGQSVLEPPETRQRILHVLQSVVPTLRRTTGLVVRELPYFLFPLRDQTRRLFELLVESKRLEILDIDLVDSFLDDTTKVPSPDPVVLQTIQTCVSTSQTLRRIRLSLIKALPDSIAESIECWKTLTDLNLPDWGSNYEGNGFPFPKFPTNRTVPLVSLKLGDFWYASDDDGGEMRFWQTLKQGAPHLTTLHLGDMNPCDNDETLDAFVQWSRQQADKLEELVFGRQALSELSDEKLRYTTGFWKALLQCTKLRLLKFNLQLQWFESMDATIDQLFQALSNLQGLICSNLIWHHSDSAIYKRAARHKPLRLLRFENGDYPLIKETDPQITEALYLQCILPPGSQVTFHSRVLLSCLAKNPMVVPQLQWLRIYTTRQIQPDWNLVAQVLPQCRHLRGLVLGRTYRVPIRYMFQKGAPYEIHGEPLRNLDKMLEVLAKHCHHLRYLQIESVGGFEAKSLATLVSNCPDLELLRLLVGRIDPKVTLTIPVDLKLIQHILTSCRRLRVLDFQGSWEWFRRETEKHSIFRGFREADGAPPTQIRKDGAETKWLDAHVPRTTGISFRYLNDVKGYENDTDITWDSKLFGFAHPDQLWPVLF